MLIYVLVSGIGAMIIAFAFKRFRVKIPVLQAQEDLHTYDIFNSNGRNSLLQLLIILGRNGRTPLLIFELAQLMGKPFGRCELTFRSRHFPVILAHLRILLIRGRVCGEW